MNRPGFLQMAAYALLLSGAGAAVFAVTAPLLGGMTVLRIEIASRTCACVAWWLHASRVRTGRLTTIVVCLFASAAAWFVLGSLTSYLLLHITLLWLVRSFYLHDSVLNALADLGLSVLALAFAIWAWRQSGSLFLALWSFFLVQALFVFLPARRGATDNVVIDDGRFARAQRAAESALRKLSV